MLQAGLDSFRQYNDVHQSHIFSKIFAMNVIFKKELLQIVRDRRLLVLGSLLLLMLAVAMYSGFNRFDNLHRERVELNELMRKDWENQEEKNAHSAAHYGTYVYAPQPPLSFLDFGVMNYVGSTVRLEAHLQQDAQFASSMENGSHIRFGDFTSSLIMQLLIPLLLIFISFNAVSGEKEQRTLTLLAIQGSSTSGILWQKIFAYTSIGGVMLTGILIAAGFSLWIQDFPINADLLTRFVVMWMIYLSYYFVISSVSVCISAWSGASKQSLLALITCWLFFVVLLPKYSTSLGDHLYPLPSRKDFQAAIRKEVQQGVDGHDPENKRTEAFRDSVLKAYGVDSVNQLKINIDGLLMQEDEDYRAMVTRKYFGRLYQQVRKQNNVSQVASLLDPAIAVRDLSMGIAQTDYASHVAFEQQVQEYRLYMMRYLNEYLSYNSKPGDWESKAPREFFRSMKKFEFRSPTVTSSLQKNYFLPLVSLVLWVVLSVLLVYHTSRKIRIV